jgi:hypothetical protein
MGWSRVPAGLQRASPLIPRKTLCDAKRASTTQIYQISDLPAKDLTFASPMWYSMGRLETASRGGDET